ncbi:MAG: hypothetical protein CMM00_01585 [Rhodopirellula sp.]|nr:hypothetical protein [Rhodopirellula sp.]
MNFRLRTLFAFIAVAAVVFTLVAGFIRITEYPRWQRRGADIVESLQSRRPANVPAKTWDDATGWAITAYHNICFSAEHVPLDSLKQFINDAESMLAGPVDLDSVDWVWSRLAECSPHGEQYRERFEPQYRLTVYGEPISNQ